MLNLDRAITCYWPLEGHPECLCVLDGTPTEGAGRSRTGESLFGKGSGWHHASEAFLQSPRGPLEPPMYDIRTNTSTLLIVQSLI